MGLFDRKICHICGSKIGLFGNRKLQDGNLCKDCAAKLSPWFSDRRSSTVDEIRAQLEYREKNQKLVNAFNITRIMGGEEGRVLLDEGAGMFMVSTGGSAKAGNPDVLKYSQITGCEVVIDEEEDEIMREEKDSEGKTTEISYDPPRFIFSYDFYIIIYVNTPYFNEMKFQINSDTVEIENTKGGESTPLKLDSISTKKDLVDTILKATKNTGKRNAEYLKYEALANEIKDTLLELRDKSLAEEEVSNESN